MHEKIGYDEIPEDFKNKIKNLAGPFEIEYRSPFLRKTIEYDHEYVSRLSSGQLIESDSKHYSIVKINKDGNRTYNKISDFILEHVSTIKDEFGIKTVFNIYQDNGKKFGNVFIDNDKTANINDFRKEIKKIDVTLTIVSDLDKILKFAVNPYGTVIKGVRQVGFADDVFISTDGAYDKNMLPIDGYIYSDDKTYIKSNIMKSSEISKEELKRLVPHIFNFNQKYICVSILAWSNACFYKMKLFKNLKYKLPILNLIGDAGSGKSTTIEVIMHNFFATENKYSATNDTKFTFTKGLSSSNCIPCFIDEYKPNKMPEKQLKLLSEIFRTLYDNTTAKRGMANQSVREFPLTAPTVVAGESDTQETALKDRTINLSYLRNTILKDETKQESLNFILDNLDLLQKLGHTLLKKSLNYEFDNKVIAEKIRAYEDKLQVKNLRIKKSIGMLLFSYELILDLLKEKGIDAPVSIDDARQYLDDGAIENIGGENSKSGLVQTLELIDSAIGFEYLKEDVHYKIRDNNRDIILYTKDAFAIINRFCKDYDLLKDYEILGQLAFQKALRDEPYFIKYDTAKLGKSSRKCFYLSLDKLSSANMDLPNIFNEKITITETISEKESAEILSIFDMKKESELQKH